MKENNLIDKLNYIKILFSIFRRINHYKILEILPIPRVKYMIGKDIFFFRLEEYNMVILYFSTVTIQSK